MMYARATCGRLAVMNGRKLFNLAGMLAILGGFACDTKTPDPPAPPTTQPTTQPVEDPATKPADAEPVATYLKLLERDRPSLADDEGNIEPTPIPLPADEASRIAFDEPIYLDLAGNLWLTHPDGLPVAELPDAGEALREQTFVTQERVRFAWWRTRGDDLPTVELLYERPDGSLGWLHRLGEASVPPAESGGFDFGRVLPIDDTLVVPTDRGVAVLVPTGRPDDADQYLRRYGHLPEANRPEAAGTVQVREVALADAGAIAPPQVRLDAAGLLAWSPWDEGLNGTPGGDRVARYADSAWSVLPASEGWSDCPVDLMPLGDGSVLQIALDANGNAALSKIKTGEATVNRAAIEQLVENLVAYDAATRDAAYAELAAAGPGIFPTLRELYDGAKPRAKREIDALLSFGSELSIGGLVPEPGPVVVRSRLGDGGVVLRFDGGVSVPNLAGVRVIEKPGWVFVRPGRRVTELPKMLADELAADPAAQLFAFGDEIVLTRPGEPAKRWGVNHFQDLLPAESDEEWPTFAGIDAMGRWLFERPPTDEAAQTLLLDTRLADPRPQLPAWVVETGELGEAGWDAEDWPIMRLGGTYRLGPLNWVPLPPETEIETRESKGGMWELAIGPDGSRYYDGVERLRQVRPDGSEVEWRLPAEAVGTSERSLVKLAADAKGRLFLFNRPGRVVRIDPTPDAAEPFEVAGVFDEEIPGAVPRRVWIDPAGRLCAAYFGDTVVIMWPDGQIPPSIRQLIPAKRRGGTTPFEGA